MTTLVYVGVVGGKSQYEEVETEKVLPRDLREGDKVVWLGKKGYLSSLELRDVRGTKKVSDRIRRQTVYRYWLDGITGYLQAAPSSRIEIKKRQNS